MSTKYIIDNLSGQTINGQPIDPKYKVFTALLTQSGGGNPKNISSGELVIGVTYFINNNDGSGDFLNVGAPSNEQATYFVATGTTPNNWGTENVVDLSFDTGAPVVTVLENTIGNIWFTFLNTGQYVVNSNTLFTENKTTVFGGYYDGNTEVWVNYQTSNISNSTIPIQTGDPIPANGYLNNTPIEIRVYN